MGVYIYIHTLVASNTITPRFICKQCKPLRRSRALFEHVDTFNSAHRNDDAFPYFEGAEVRQRYDDMREKHKLVFGTDLH